MSGTARAPSDDKGGMAVMVAALRAMQAAGTLKKANITIVLTGDEEDAGNPIAICARRPDRRRASAPTSRSISKGWRAATARTWARSRAAARAAGRVTVTGHSAHSSGVFRPGAGYGAIYELVRIIDQFRRELPEDKLTYNVGLIGGGQTAELDAGQIRLEATGKTNIIAATAIARGDLRAHQSGTDRPHPGEDAGDRRPVAGRRQGRAQLRPGLYPPMAPTDGNRALLAGSTASTATWGWMQMGELDPLKRGAGDISFVAADVDGLVGLGPAGSAQPPPSETRRHPVDRQPGQARRDPDEPLSPNGAERNFGIVMA